jgi:hypothetical protein
MAFTFSDFQQHLIDNNGILTRQNILNFRNHYHSLEMTGQWLQQLVDLAEDIDFVNSHPSIYTLFEKVIVDFVLTDDDQSDIDEIYDVVTETEGDNVVIKLQAAAFPNDLKRQILLKIDESASAIESQNLIDAINIVKS